MPFFILLLKPKVRKFELIQFQKTPEKPTIQGVLEQTSQLSANPEFKEQEHIGFYCPKTKKELLLPGASLPKSSSSPILSVESSDASSATSGGNGSTSSTAGAAIAAAAASVDKENNTEINNNKAETNKPVDEDKLEKQEEDPVLKDETNVPNNSTSADRDTTTDDAPPAAQEGQEASSPKEQQPDLSDVLDFESIGMLLVAIPKDTKLRKIVSLAQKIMDSPAFKILTQNSNLEQPKTPLAQELEQLKRASRTKHVSQHLQQSHEQNSLVAQAYQEQEQDLQARRKQRLEAEQTRDITVTPDAHGLSPLDAMRVAQNQQKAADREKERATLQQYQRHSDTMLVVDTSTTTADHVGLTLTGNLPITPGGDSSSELLSPFSQATSTGDSDGVAPSPEPSPIVTDHEGDQLFVSPAATKRQSIEQQKQAELEAIRQQGLAAKTKSQKAFVVAEELSVASTKRASMEQQRAAELASLQGSKSRLSWNPPTSSPVPSPANASRKTIAVTNRSVKSMVMVSNSTSVTTSKATLELQELKAKNAMNSSLREIPSLEPPKPANTLSSSLSELEQLRGLGLAQSLKNQFTDVVKANELQTRAHLAQQRDLEERRAKTKVFQASRNTDLSAADVQQLELSKQKKEERQKEREALGYYQSPRGEGTEGEQSKEWKTTGKVLTTMGQAVEETTTKEWEAPREDAKMEVSPPTLKTTGSGKAGTADEQAKEQGCACIIL